MLFHQIKSFTAKKASVVKKIAHAVGCFGLTCTLVMPAPAQQTANNMTANAASRAQRQRSQNNLVERIRRELVTIPFFDVFDWLEGNVTADGVVTLRGQVVRPTIKSEAEERVRDIEGVTQVRNEIEVLPLSPNDDRIRLAVYRELFNFDSPLFRYSTRAVPPIHIVVKNGRVALRGVVATDFDKQIAYTRARTVPGTFEVTNELVSEQELERRNR